MAKVKVGEFTIERAQVMGIPEKLMRTELEEAEYQEEAKAREMAVQQAAMEQGGGNA